ncbi:MAG TPA: M48 family metallopeptidase [Flavisolibacter sp.]
MSRTLAFLCSFIAFASCNEIDSVLGREQKKQVTYSFACLDSAVGGGSVGRRLEQAGDLIRDIAVSEKSITDSVQTAYGEAFHQQMTADGSFKLLNDPALSNKLNGVLNSLLLERTNPSTIRYRVYALADTAVNAFTFGGRIYVTKAMLQKCAGKDALLYAIIGHEIGHSERGHIKATIQELELSNKWFGEGGGATFFGIKKLLTASMNQKNELEADYYGIELTNSLGFDVCTAVAFWKEMASNENRYSQVEDFFRSHPFSNLRSECLSIHLRNNFGKECGVVPESGSLPQVTN